RTARVIIATIGAVVVVGGLAAVGIVSKNKHAPAQPPAALTGAAVGAAPTGLSEDPNAGLAGSKQYQDIVAGAGKERAKDALAKGQSTQPVAATVESALKATPTPAEQAAS